MSQEVIEESVGHTMAALVGHVEANGLYSDQSVTSQGRGMIFRRVMWSIDWRWASAGMCSYFDKYIKCTFISKGDAWQNFELIRSCRGVRVVA